MIGATMGSALVTMLLALFFFSTPALRCKPVFILNVMSLLLGIGYAMLQVYQEFRSLLFPNISQNPNVFLLSAAWIVTLPVLVDGILLLRINAVYPRAQTPRFTYWFVMGVPILTMVARLLNSAVFLSRFIKTINTRAAAGQALEALAFRLPSIKIEWSLQLFDDIFSSAIFLTRVYQQTMFTHGRTMSQTLRTLFWIFASNFVFPVILGSAQLAVYLMDPASLTSLYIEAVNFHFTIMGVVFATLWVAESEWAGTRNVSSDKYSSPTPSTLALAAGRRREKKTAESPITVGTEVYRHSFSDSLSKEVVEHEYDMEDRCTYAV
ncbi:hypothetical protein MSAN_01804800 [Mycena sanguinolenta]|uniref:Uncharacterized protein n=1 Tax=Mycena sanguinolenta TaxID=230812 RepID=A0A8H6XUK5_9AGAR|nr:hypothetical protein MSAN_01804800 [Mycena sanguinolenta]